MSVGRIALIGFGEVGQTLAQDLAGQAEITAWDVAFADPKSGPSRALSPAICAALGAAQAVRGAGLVISAVTAAQTLAGAQSVAPSLEAGAFFLDLNSCSPGQKRAAADVIDGVGGRYVEAAVMSPIQPRRIASPMLLGGAHAADFLRAADGLGFAGARVYAAEIGKAAATKLCRSVMIKGVEALLAESLLAARRYGVEQAVLDSLSDLLPAPDWNARAQYMIARSLEHGARRAEEMREAAHTVEEAGVRPLMSEAIAQRQDWAGGHKGAISGDLREMLDGINDEDLRR